MRNVVGIFVASIFSMTFPFVAAVNARPGGKPAARSAAPVRIGTAYEGSASGAGSVSKVRGNASRDAGANSDYQQAGLSMPGVSQRNSSAHNVSLNKYSTIPELKRLPLRANVGQAHQTLLLKGRGLDRIESITSTHAAWTLASVPAGKRNLSERGATITLDAGVHVGDVITAKLVVRGLQKPITVPDAVKVVGPLPKIIQVKKSFIPVSGVQLLRGEIPAGTAVSFQILATHAGSYSELKIACKELGDSERTMVLIAGTRRGSLAFDAMNPGSFFLSLDPGSMGRSDCLLTVAIVNPATGNSKSSPLGRVILLPRIDKFVLTAKKIYRRLYRGTLTGQDLQVIEKTGWNRRAGFKVLGIPTPVPGGAKEQTLQVAMSWPPPSPHAHLYVWLNGEREGRRTSTTY